MFGATSSMIGGSSVDDGVAYAFRLLTPNAGRGSLTFKAQTRLKNWAHQPKKHPRCVGAAISVGDLSAHPRRTDPDGDR